MTLATIVLTIHVAAGTIGLAAGSVALFATKGGRLHVGAGRVFWTAMIVAGSTALALALLRPNPFLFLVGVFSLYLVVSGRRALRPEAPAALDRALAWAMASCGAAMIALAALGALSIRPLAIKPAMLPVLAVFGAIGAGLAIRDLADFSRAMDRQRRLRRHVTRIVPGLIAAVTPVLVVNGTQLPVLVRWLGPTVALAPVAAYYVARIRRGTI